MNQFTEDTAATAAAAVAVQPTNIQLMLFIPLSSQSLVLSVYVLSFRSSFHSNGKYAQKCVFAKDCFVVCAVDVTISTTIKGSSSSIIIAHFNYILSSLVSFVICNMAFNSVLSLTFWLLHSYFHRNSLVGKKNNVSFIYELCCAFHGAKFPKKRRKERKRGVEQSHKQQLLFRGWFLIKILSMMKIKLK